MAQNLLEALRGLGPSMWGPWCVPDIGRGTHKTITFHEGAAVATIENQKALGNEV